MTNLAALTKQAKAFRRATFLPLAVCSRLWPRMLLAWLSSSWDAVNLFLHNTDNSKKTRHDEQLDQFHVNLVFQASPIPLIVTLTHSWTIRTVMILLSEFTKSLERIHFTNCRPPTHQPLSMLVMWYSGKNVGLDWKTFPVAHSIFSWWVTRDHRQHIAIKLLSTYWTAV